MVERIEDLNLPNAVIARLIKEAIPDGSNVSKEARAAIAKAASVFAIFVTSSSTALAHKQNHRTITAKDILQTLNELDFESFVPSLTQDLEVYRKMVKDKKESKANKKDTSTGDAAASSSSAAAATENGEAE
ncbi:DNA polymerase epsilon subunit 3 [Drosophila nasuta]|uniref:DNA polymerase epsilon subunit 3 n=1 Tax=Drosophila albomicans TaxID=7291 RepID=A0A6P8XD55_DROAB|nr:DNA polymerase epsilon subunit 3 [Drosophila albomicans]XP_060666645.1 DNA polymerase epsilon subunit 3 [Drosophila nasuta]